MVEQVSNNRIRGLDLNDERLLRYFKIQDGHLHLDVALVLQSEEMDSDELVTSIISYAKQIKPVIDRIIEIEEKVPDELKQGWW